MAGIKDIKFLTRPVQKFQAGGTAGVLDFDAIPEIMSNIKRPNLMGDPTKIGLESLGPLFAMAAAGMYPAVSALTEAEARDRGIIQPPDELTEEEKKRLGLYGGMVGGGFEQLSEKDKLPNTTAGEIPKIDTNLPPTTTKPEEKAEPVGGGFTELEDKDKLPTIITMAEGDKPDYFTARQDQQNKARKEAGIKAKEIFEENTDKPFYSKNEGVVSIFDLISQGTGYKSRETVVKMLQEQGVDISPTVKPGVKPDNFSKLVKESKDKSTKKYQKSITEQVLQIYEANKDLPMSTGKENQPTIMEIMQENVPSFQTGQKVSLKTIKEILQNEDVYAHTASGEPQAKNLATEISKVTGEGLTEFSPMFTRGIDLKEFPSIGKLNKFFRSQGIELENLNEILSNNPEKFNDLEATRKKIQIEFLSPKTAKSEESIAFNKALATQAENYDRNGNFMPIVLQKMHPNELLRPQDIESQFGSIDIENVRLGGSTVNTVVQPEHAKALQTYIKNKDVENTNRIINTLEEYHILTNLNNMLDKEDYQWLEQNKIIEIPKISYKGEEFSNTDAVMFGAKQSPSIEKIIEAELKARKNFGLKFSVYQEMKDKGEKLPSFDTYLKDGGMVGISHLTRPLGNF